MNETLSGCLSDSPDEKYRCDLGIDHDCDHLAYDPELFQWPQWKHDGTWRIPSKADE